MTPSSRLSVTERDDLRTLELREVTVEDAGLYRVTLENEMGSIEATARLDIIGKSTSRLWFLDRQIVKLIGWIFLFLADDPFFCLSQ